MVKCVRVHNGAATTSNTATHHNYSCNNNNNNNKLIKPITIMRQVMHQHAFERLQHAASNVVQHILQENEQKKETSKQRTSSIG
jgi:hypothetical protein